MRCISLRRQIWFWKCSQSCILYVGHTRMSSFPADHFLIHESITISKYFIHFLICLFHPSVCWYDVEEEAERMVFVPPGKKRALQGSCCCLQIHNGWLQEGAKLFLKFHSKMRGNKPQIWHWKFWLNIRIFYFLFFPLRTSATRTGCLGMLWNIHPWKY